MKWGLCNPVLLIKFKLQKVKTVKMNSVFELIFESVMWTLLFNYWNRKCWLSECLIKLFSVNSSSWSVVKYYKCVGYLKVALWSSLNLIMVWV